MPFTGGGVFPVQYDVDYQGHSYYIRYRHGWLTVTRDFGSPKEVEVYEQQLTQEPYHGEWSDEVTTVYLALLSQAIREDDFRTLCLPSIEEALQHPYALQIHRRT